MTALWVADGAAAQPSTSLDVAHGAAMGLLVSVAAPLLLVLLGRVAPSLDRWTLPGTVTLPGFVVLHAVVTAYEHGPGSLPLDAIAHVVLLAGALLFWAPVLGARRRLPDAGRMLYLYTAIPLLDMAGVYLVAVGDSAGGLSMIAGMIPLGFTAVVMTWNWISREERRAVLDEMAAAATTTSRGG